MKHLFCWFSIVLLVASGCSSKNAVEGKVAITSTEVFSKMKGSKSPPPQVPKG